MWEEEPWYQKQQAKIIGVLVLFFLVLYTVYFIVERDWDYLKNLLLIVAGVMVFLALLVASVWMLLKIFVPERRDKTKAEGQQDT